MSFQQVEEIIEKRKEEYTEVLYQLLRQKSISVENDGILDCANMVKEIMGDIGINTSLIETKGHPVVYGEMIKDPEAFTILFYGHYDVQPPDPIDEWLSPPFEPTVREGKIYCRGAGDNKGQFLGHILAIKTYLAVFDEVPINIKILIEGEEEIGSKNLPTIIEENKDLLKCDLVYTSDGPMHASGAPLVLPGVRGMLFVELTAQGAKWDNHSGNKGNIVPNPAFKLVELLNTMRDSEGNILIEGFYDDMQEPTQAELDLIKSLPFNLEETARQVGYEDLDMDGETYYRELTLKPTFNIAGFHSGYGGDGVKTIIPATATLKIDMRLIADQDPTDIYEKLCKHVEKHAPGVKVKHLGEFVPSKTPIELDVIQQVKQAVGEAYKQKPILQPCMGGSLPDYVWTKILGSPSVVVPYANFDEANHSPNENIGLENFINGIKCTSHVIHKFGQKDNKNKDDVKVELHQ